jgi:hypothetical protein
MKKYVCLGIFLSVFICCDLVEGTYNNDDTGEFEGTVWQKIEESVPAIPVILQFSKTEVTITGTLKVNNNYNIFSGTYRAWKYEDEIKIRDDDDNITITKIVDGGLEGFNQVK